jgi:hypothetical protein
MRLLLILSLVLSLTGLFAQEYVRPGFVVLNTGDTLRGYIKDMEWAVNPSAIEFQASQEGAVTKYDVSMIRSFATSRPAYYDAWYYEPGIVSTRQYQLTIMFLGISA